MPFQSTDVYTNGLTVPLDQEVKPLAAILRYKRTLRCDSSTFGLSVGNKAIVNYSNTLFIFYIETKWINQRINIWHWNQHSSQCNCNFSRTHKRDYVTTCLKNSWMNCVLLESWWEWGSMTRSHPLAPSSLSSAGPTIWFPKRPSSRLETFKKGMTILIHFQFKMHEQVRSGIQTVPTTCLSKHSYEWRHLATQSSFNPKCTVYLGLLEIFWVIIHNSTRA